MPTLTHLAKCVRNAEIRVEKLGVVSSIVKVHNIPQAEEEEEEAKKAGPKKPKAAKGEKELPLFPPKAEVTKPAEPKVEEPKVEAPAPAKPKKAKKIKASSKEIPEIDK
jgi:hypothetical protein